MNYQKYKSSRDAAWDVLIKSQVSELPVDILGICKLLGVKVKYKHFDDGNDGIAQIVRGRAVILIEPDRPRERKRFTIAHELGHILLGHVGKYELVSREPSPNDSPIEHEANVFASRLLAPACVLWGLDLHTPEEIMRVCDISYTAASIRAERMKELYTRNKFLISPRERLVYKQFEKYIKYRQHQEDC